MKFPFSVPVLATLAFALPALAQAPTPGEKLARDYAVAKSKEAAAGLAIKMGSSSEAESKRDVTALAKSSLQAKTLLSRGVKDFTFSQELITLLRASYNVRIELEKSDPAQEAIIDTNFLIAAQNAQIIEQNKQVIALLTKIAAKK